MTNLYKELKDQHGIQVNNFPMFFAFDENQFNEGMNKLGLEQDEKAKLLSTGYGGFILKADRESYTEMFSQQDQEMKTAINNSDKFIFDMFNYELANHEYSYTYEIDDTLNALGLTYEQVQSDKRLLNGLNAAKEYQQESEQ